MHTEFCEETSWNVYTWKFEMNERVNEIISQRREVCCNMIGLFYHCVLWLC